MSRKNITRKTVDLTAAQAAVLSEMIAAAEARATEATGLPIRIGTREFFHMLLKKYADEMGLVWPEDYPAPGGWRGARRGDQPNCG